MPIGIAGRTFRPVAAEGAITRSLGPHRYTVPWIALGTVRSLEAHVPGAVITQYSTEDQLWRFSGGFAGACRGAGRRARAGTCRPWWCRRMSTCRAGPYVPPVAPSRPARDRSGQDLWPERRRGLLPWPRPGRFARQGSRRRTPSIVQADRLARALGTTLSEMLTEVERG